MSQQRAKQPTDDQIPADLREAAGLLLPGHGDVSTVAGAPETIRVETIQGLARVTRWPAGTTVDRIAAIHALFQTRAEGAASFLPAPISGPAGVSVAMPGGRRYDARGWLAGSPASRDLPIPGVPLPTPISVDHVAAAGRAIAALHLAGEPIVNRRLLGAVPLTTYHQQTTLLCRAAREQLTPISSSYPPMREWVKASDRIIPVAADAIATLLEGAERRFVASHGALWPEHILFVRQEDGMPEVSGLAGWANANASSPLLDLAQLVSRTRGWSHETTEAVVESYGAVAPLTPIERRALPLIVGLDLLREGARLLSVYMMRDEAVLKHSQYTLVYGALERTLDAIEAIVPAIGGFDSPSPKRGRKWVYRPKPAAQSGAKRPPRPRPRKRPDAE